MDKETLSTVLSLLGSDEEQAAEEYRSLHERLARFFAWNNAVDPEALADEAIDRLGRRAVKTGVQSVPAFVLGIARNMLQEELRRQQKMKEIGRQWNARTGGAASAEAEQMHEALGYSMTQLRADRRALIEAYYLYNGSMKVKAHQKLAEEQGLTVNALRNRAMRARQELETAIRAYLDGKSR